MFDLREPSTAHLVDVNVIFLMCAESCVCVKSLMLSGMALACSMATVVCKALLFWLLTNLNVYPFNQTLMFRH